MVPLTSSLGGSLARQCFPAARKRLRGRHMARLEERLSEMRPAESPALGDLTDSVKRDRVAEGVQLLHHQRDATSAVLTQPAEPLLERIVLRIDEIREDMDVAPL